jgi:predicted HTH domain antitoxin
MAVTGTGEKQAVIRYPDGLAQSMKLSDAEFVAELAFLAAAKLFELGRLSSGRAARLAGLPRLEFIHRLARIGVAAINIHDEEIEAEVQAARELAG